LTGKAFNIIRRNDYFLMSLFKLVRFLVFHFF
jgi:hypothetical protein